MIPLLSHRRRAQWIAGCVLAGLALACPSRLNAQSVTNLTLSPTTVALPGSSTGTITLTNAPNGTVVCLNTSNPQIAIVPQSCVVTNNSATFTVSGAGASGTATIVASCNNTSRTANVTFTGGGGGGGGSNYSYELHDIPVNNASVLSYFLADIYMPRTIKTGWTTTYNVSPTFEVRRDGTSLGTTSNLYWTDPFTFVSGTLYQYSVRITGGSQTLGLPPPPMGADPMTIAHLPYVSAAGPWTTINVTPNEALATDNQAIDSRLDLRYSTNVFKDFNFGTKIYRGGLFAGFGSDPSRVGRSFLKYSLPAWPTGQNVWIISSVNAYYTRSLKNGTALIGCQVADTGWTQTGLVWSTSPTINPAAATKTFSVTYDGTDASAKWCRWDLLPDIINALLSPSRLFGCALAATDETASQWAYFAKKEWNSGAYAPIVLYAYGAPLQLYQVNVNPNLIPGGSQATATVELNGPAPTGGVALQYWTSVPGAAYPAACSVTIPAGSVSVTFPINTNVVGSNTSVVLTVSTSTLGTVSTMFTVQH